MVAALGFVADLGPLQKWGIDVQKRHILVDAAMRTNLPRVFAAGDITEYPGKVRLIGLSNETPWGTMRFLQASEHLGLPRPDYPGRKVFLTGERPGAAA